MSELATEYEGKITTSVRPATNDEGVAAKEKYGWADPLHGLVALLPDGTVVSNLPGHSYAKSTESAKAEIKTAIEKLLVANAR